MVSTHAACPFCAAIQMGCVVDMRAVLLNLAPLASSRASSSSFPSCAAMKSGKAPGPPSSVSTCAPCRSRTLAMAAASLPSRNAVAMSGVNPIFVSGTST